ncbi:spindle assembly checkpoint kinase [Hypoxylon argillaceum]|nr:spindle assembly checkpoint kinase [Hypoxylon argillaceum]
MHQQTINHTIQWPLGIKLEDLVGAGITALVVRLDAVIKFAAHPAEQPLIEREKAIYQRLGHDHDGVLRYYGNLGDALILQYASHGSIRQYYASQTKSVSLSLQLRWVEQITAAVSFIHSRNVLHGDISCNNVMIDDGLNAKLGDFAGSSIDGQDHLICYETSHAHPEMIGISTASDIFALGSTFYEVMTGSKPYRDLSNTEIERAYKEGNYPSLVSLAAFNDIIHKCWTQGYASVGDLLEDVKAEVTTKSTLVVLSQPSALRHTIAFPIALTLMSLLPILFWARNRR